MKEVFLYIALGIVGVIGVCLLFWMIIKIQKARIKFKEKYSVIQVRVSALNEAGPISAETIFSTLHGIQTKFSLWEELKGYSTEHISFEIASINRIIKFYVAFPEHLRNLVEGQIYAQYPDVEIEDCPDYAKKLEADKQVFGVELILRDADVYPVKRYTQFEDKLAKVAVDPIAGLTSALVKFDDPEDQAWIQIVTTPMDDKWRITFTKCVKLLNKGIFANIEYFQKRYARAFITRKGWPKIVFFPLYFFFWLEGLMINAGISFDETSVNTKNLLDKKNMDEATSKGHERETGMDAAMDKVVRPLFAANIRVIYVPKNPSQERAKIKLTEIVGAFKQFNFPHLNGFKVKQFMHGKDIVDIYSRRLIDDNGFVLNNEELATIYHLPTLTVKTPTIYWVKSKKLEPPNDLPTQDGEFGDSITLLGKTNFRGSQQIFGVKPEDRRRHLYIIGKTGMGKSTLLENMIYSDIVAGKGVGVVDPHGDLADAVLRFVPSDRTNDVVLIDPSDKEYAVAFNMLENIDPALNTIVCSGLVGIFKKIYADSWGPRLEHILRNTILALLEYPGTTMLGITRILQDDDFRDKVVRKIEDPVVKSFWVNEFAKMQDKFRIEAISPILNKVGQFLASPVIRNIVGQPKSTVDLKFFMDKGKIVIVNLSKGKIGEDNSALLGAMMITKFQLDAMSRANVVEKERKDFYLYVDEFQNFATDSFATILSEARKYRLNLTMANQYIAQMPEEVRDAVFGNVGSTLAFQVGFDDAEYISQQFGEEVLPPDLVSLSKYNAYMRLLIDGMPTKTFSLTTLPPPPAQNDAERIEKIVKVCRERYATKITVIQDKIKRWSENKPLKND